MFASFRARSWLLPLILSVVLALLAGHAYLGRNFPFTHDGENHLARFANYKIALKEGQFPPRLAPNLMNHYGYPVLNYNYPLANILSLPFSFLRINDEVAFKAIVIGGLLFGLWGTWLWLDELQFHRLAKIAGLVAFATAPYVLTLLFFRGDIGEILALMLWPWLYWWLERAQKTSWSNFLWVAGFGLFTAFSLAHNIAAVFGLPFLLGYATVKFGKQKQPWQRLGTTLLATIGLSLWFWLPALAEKNQVVLDGANVNTEVLSQFIRLKQVFFSPIQFGFSYPGGIDSLSVGIGLSLAVALILATLLLIKSWIQPRTPPAHRWLFSVIAFVCWLLIFGQISASTFLWKLVPVAAYLQFPWRLTLFLTPLAILLVAFVIEQANLFGKGILIFCLAFQILVTARLKPVDTFHHDQIDYDLYAQSTSTLNENLPKTFKYLLIGDWQPAPTLLQGSGQIAVQSWTGTTHRYSLELQTPAIITEPTMNYLGWETQIKSHETILQARIAYTDSHLIAGRIAYQLPAGSYQVLTRFTQHTPARTIGNVVSLLTAGLLLVIITLRGVRPCKS